MEQKTGVLLVNLGTPDSPEDKDVHRYLIEFLTDSRVIDTSWLWRQLLVRGIIGPSRYKQSAKAYREIWTDEGSPLKLYGFRLQENLQKRLGKRFHVELAMRYQSPSIDDGLARLRDSPVDHLIVLPMFPQYASATTGSVHQKVMEVISRWDIIPQLTLMSSFAAHPSFIKAICAVSSPYHCNEYDHVLFSFHGLPRRQLLKVDKTGQCLKNKDCCGRICVENQHCYSAQCFATANAMVRALNLQKNQYSIAFQSRLGKDPWLEPYTSEAIAKLAKEGKKRILVFCPSFVCDCLETIYEIGVEYASEFKHAGGETLDLVSGLNDHPQWIEALETMIKECIKPCNDEKRF